ncbi:MAG: NAD(P)/FAD-dependent oxidoreductase [Erysipelotrichales bacterium]
MKDVSIIGGGPIGMYACVYASIRELSVNLIESMPTLGGQPAALYGEKIIGDLPGYSKIEANEFIDNLNQQIELNRKDLVDIYTNQEIVKVERVEDYFRITSNTNNVYESRTILITAGSGVFKPRPIGIDKEEQFDNILYSVSNLSMFDNKEVTILGGGDSALDWALMLDDRDVKVNIVHRRDEYRAKEDSIAKLDKSNVKQYMSYLVEDLEGSNDKLEKVVIKHKEAEEVIKLEQDYLLVNYGNITKVSDFGGLDLEKYPQGYITNRVFETSLDGIYACGNAIHYEGRPKLIAIGLGEVPVVINNIKGFIDPTSKNKIFYSTMQQ